MSEFKNNHFVPRLVLRRFSKKITTYNVHTGILIEDRKCEDVFVERELYPLQLEKMFNKNVEGKFGDLLNNNILKATDECILNRKELMIVKKFLLVAMLRVVIPDRYREQEVYYRNRLKEFYKFEEKVVENENEDDRWLRNLKVVLESKTIEDIQKHPDVTFEAFRWANIFNSGYLAIWDNTNTNEDFIVTDIGMTSEQDLLLYVKKLNQKLLYLEKALKSENNHYNKNLYLDFVRLIIDFHENFFMFSISKNRMLVLISPFFKLYDKNDTPTLPIPDIWTSKIEDKSLFEKNKVKYTRVVNGKIIKSENDIFTYKIHNLNKKDAIYINLLMLDRIENTVGFADLSKVRRTIYHYNKRNDQKVNYGNLVKLMKEKDLL